jgi:hypothetical protein
MNRTISAALIGAGTIALLGLGGVAQAAPSPKSNQLTCFDGTSDGGGFNGVCTRNGGGSFTLNNNDNDTEPNNAYAGVSVEHSALTGMRFADITQLGFSYSGDISGGSPRYSLPVAGGGYVFIDAASCNDGAGHVAPLTDSTCAVQSPTGYYSSYAAFTTAEPGLAVGDAGSFIVADQPGIVTVSNIQLGRVAPGKTK